VLQPTLAFDGAQQGELVGVLNAAAGRQPLGDAGNAALAAAQHACQIVGGHLAFDVGTQCENHFEFGDCGMILYYLSVTL